MKKRLAGLSLSLTLLALSAVSFGRLSPCSVGQCGGGQGGLSPAAQQTYNSVLFSSTSSQLMDIGNTAQYAYNQPFTIEIWEFFTSSAGVIISNYHPPAPGFFQGYALTYNNALFWGMENQTERIRQTYTLPSLNGWHLITVGADGSGLVGGLFLAVDGILQSPSATLGTSLTGPIGYNGATSVGGNAVLGYSDGYIAGAAFYNAALSSTNILNHWDNGRLADLTNAPNLNHWYRMGNGPGDTTSVIKDQVGTADGTLVNGPTTVTFTPFALQAVGTSSFGNYPAMFQFSGTDVLKADYHSNTTEPAPFPVPDLTIYSFTSPNTLSAIGSLPTQYTSGSPNGPGPLAFLQEGNIGYATYYKNASPNFLKVLDLSNLSSPSVLRTVSDGVINATFTSGLVKKGNYIYAPTQRTSDGAGYLEIVDATTPSAASLINTVATSIATTGQSGAVVNGSYLYITGQNPKGLQIYDISGANATAPVLKSTLTTLAAGPNGITLDPSGNYVYLTEYTSGTTGKLEVVNVSSATAPSIVFTTTVPWTPMMSVINPTRKLLFIPCFDSGEIVVFSTYDPVHPFLAATLSLGSDSHSILKNPQWLALLNDALYCSNSASTGLSAESYGYLEAFQL